MSALHRQAPGSTKIDRFSTRNWRGRSERPLAMPPPENATSMNSRYASSSWPNTPSKVHPHDMPFPPCAPRRRSIAGLPRQVLATGNRRQQSSN